MTERKDEEVTPGGSTVYRHGEVKPFKSPVAAAGNFDEIEAHVTRHIGETSAVWHEIVSDQVHIDVIIVPPAPERDYTTLVTSGMSELPMTVPEEHPEPEEARYAELVLALPASWRLEEADLEDEDNYWPVRLLKFLARFPHSFGTWLSYGHSIPHGDPPEAYASSTKMNGALLGPPLLMPEDFHRLVLADGRIIRFWAIYPLYAKEMDLKLQDGADAIIERLAEADVTELLDPQRQSIAARKGWWPF